MKTASIFILLFFFCNLTLFGQLSKEDIKQLLVLQGDLENIDLSNETNRLYNDYLETTQYKTPTFLTAMTLSLGNGLSLGIHQSHTALYKHTEWLPDFMQNWMKQRLDSEGPYSLFLQTNKVFREIDYVTDRMAYHNWKRFYGDSWILAYISHTAIKNITAHFVRKRTQTGHW